LGRRSRCRRRAARSPRLAAAAYALSLLAAVALPFCLALPARAINPARRLSQYGHTAWRTQDGDFSGIPTVITQTTDGYLWLGTSLGLVRFDGNRFLPWTFPPGERLPDSRVLALAGTTDGSLWIGTANGVSRWTENRLVDYPRPPGRIEAMIPQGTGAVWMVRTQTRDSKGPLCRMDGSSLQCQDCGSGIPFDAATKIAADRQGMIWIGGYFGLCRWTPGASQIYLAKRPSGDRGVGELNAVASAPDGSVWASLEEATHVLRLERFFHGVSTTRLYPQIPGGNGEITALFVDRDNAIWLGTAHHGLFRIRGTQVEHFGSEDGLSSNAIASFYQDREGTIWVATSDGVDNFHDLHVETFSMREGLYADGASSLFAARDGTVWVGDFQSLNLLRNGKLSAITEGHGLPGRNVTTILEDHAGRLWVGIDKGLWVYQDGVFRPILHADGSLLGTTFSIAEDADHSIWTRSGPNLDHIRDFKVAEETTSAEIAKCYILAAHPSGGIVLGLTNGELLRYAKGQSTLLSSNDSRTEIAPRNNVGDMATTDESDALHIRDLLVQTDGAIWGTTQVAFFLYKDGQRKNLTVRNGLPCENVYSLLDDRRGSLWLFMSCGLVRIPVTELDRWWDHPDTIVRATLAVGTLDGVQPGITPLKPQMAMTPDGRIWLVNGRILQVFNPNEPSRNEIPPPVQIEQVVADRNTYVPQEGLRLPPRTRDLEIDYAALSFVVPREVRYRYRLEGHDPDWVQADNRHQAFYSDLSPGDYHFHVLASNNDGVWNETGASLDFRVAPAYYQTNAFRTLCAVLLLFSLWLLYRLRMWRMRETIVARFDERMAERTRLARELHDTLLQTIQGSKMVADDALENSTDAGHMRRALERLSLWMEQATQEGRAALNSLRTSTTQGNDLAKALERAARECSANSGMEFALRVDGVAREMHPIVRDEVYRVAYEAIRNACSHSGGSRLEVDLSYGRDLILRVRDNGKGIHPAIAAAGKDGHFGLKGMHERALRVGGSLTLSSSAFSGTEVELSVPSTLVFSPRRAARTTPMNRLRAALRRASRPSDDK
jgi:signal transduction histidine kinase/ligand-binding sensor domain-containing protein